MSERTKISLVQLKIAHEFYSKLGKVIWMVSLVLFLAGAAQFSAGLYASEMNAPIRTAVNYGYAMNGDSELKAASERPDPCGKSIGDGFATMIFGFGGIAFAFYLRRKFHQYLALPEADKMNAQTIQFGSRSMDEILWGRTKTTSPSYADEIVKLDNLRTSGALSDEEFSVAKMNLLKRFSA